MMNKSKRLLAIILSLALLAVSTVVSIAAQTDDTATALKAAFAAYVEKNGNSIVYSDVVAGVAAELTAAGSTLTADDITLAEGDFYIKHAVDGVVDEDPDPTTRINIPGSDGAAAAIFTVGGTRYSMVEVIPHEVENLGLLAVTKNDINENGELYAATFTESGVAHKMIITSDVTSINQDVKLYSGTVDDLVAIVMTGFGSTSITTTVGYSDTLNGVKALVMSDNITSIAQNWAFSGLTSLKYLHLPTGLTSISGGNFATCPVLENVNFDDVTITKFQWDSFKECSMLYEVVGPTASTNSGSALKSGPDGRNYVEYDAEMTFAQAAAYAASNANAYEYEAGYTEESITTAFLDKVVCTGMTTDWNDTLAFDNETATLSGTLTMTYGTDSFDIPLSVVNDNVNYNVEDIKTAFKNYVKENGNSITYANVVSGVAAELAELGSSYVAANLGLAEADFYIRHAVDGVVDEDPDPTTRINIPGNDGAVAATFTVDGQRISMVEVIPHTVENLGVLAVTKNDINENGELYAATFTESGVAHKMIITSDVKSINQNVKLYSGTVDDLVAIVMTGFGSTSITTNVGYSDTLNGVKALVMSDNITAIACNWAFSGLTSLKYVHLSTGLTSISGGNFATCPVLENVNFHEVEIAKFQWDSFKECSMLYEVVGPTASTNSGSALTSGPDGRNYVVYDAEMTFAQAVAYAASNASTYEWDNDYTEESVTAAVLDKVVCTGMTSGWNDTLVYDENNLMLTGTFTLSNGTDSFNVALEVANEDFEIATEDLKAAFDAYVEANGNDVTYANILDGVKAELNKAGIPTPNNFITLATADFYIKHAVDGVIDEDPNPETQINIPGSDGAVSAVFVVDGVRVPLIKAIPHEVENLGVLETAKVDSFTENGKVYVHAVTVQGSGLNKIVLDGCQFNNTVTAYGDYSKLAAIVFVNQPDTLDKQVGGNLRDQDGNTAAIFGSVKVVQFADTAVTFASNWAWSCFPGAKYLHLPENGNFTWETFRNWYALENVNIPMGLDWYQDHFLRTATSLLEVYGPIAQVSNNSFKEGNPNRNFVVAGAEMSFAQAMAYAQANAGDFDYEIGMTADEIAAEILGGRLVYSAGLTADWNDTYKYDKEAMTVSGILTVADASGNTMDIEFYRDFGAEIDVPAMNYLAFDTSDTAVAIELDDVTNVTEVGVEVTVTTANGTETYTYSSDYINTAAKNQKPWLAFADKTYYCDVDMDGAVASADLIAMKKILLGVSDTTATANVNGADGVDVLDFIRLKKLMAAEELDFTALAYTNYTYAFTLGDALAADGIESVTVKPYCVMYDITFYGEGSSLSQFSTDWTVLVKP